MKKRCFLRMFIVLVIFYSENLHGQIITNFAGSGSTLGDGGAAILASVPFPYCGAFDSIGNYYFGENTRIRMVDTNGIIHTVAGTGIAGFSGDGGNATFAQINNRGVTVDRWGNIYIGDYYNYRVRKVDIATGIVHTIAGTGVATSTGDGGPATAATLIPNTLCVDIFGNIYVFDSLGLKIRKIDTTGIITTVAGNGIVGYTGDGGPATSAEISGGVGICTDSLGNLFFGCGNTTTIRKISISTGVISTVAGTLGVGTSSGDGGPAELASFSEYGIAFDGIGELYIADFNNRIRRINTSGIINTVAGDGVLGYSGDGGLAINAELHDPEGVAIDACGNLYIADEANSRIRKVTFDTTGIPSVSISTEFSDTICAGSFASYSAVVATGSAITYHWYVNGVTTSATSNSYTYTPANGDSIRCVLRGVSQCSGDTVTVTSNTIYMTVTPVATPTITLTSSASAAVGSIVTVNATVSGAGVSYSVNWYDNGVLFSTTTVPMTTYTKGASTDNITATVIPSPIEMLPGCYDSSTSSAFTITVSNNGVNNVAEPRIYVYPNPVSTILNINNVTAQEPYSLLSIVGSTLQKGILQPGNNKISIEGLAAGIYMLEVTSEAGEKTVTKIARQ